MDGSSPPMDALILKRQTEALKAVLAFMRGNEGLDLCSISLKGHMTDLERQALLELVLSTFCPDQAEEYVREAFKGAGYPTPALSEDAMSEARWWAGNATAKEIGAYAVACYERMSPKWQQRFKEKING